MKCNKCNKYIKGIQVPYQPHKADVMFIGDFPPKEDYDKHQHISRQSSRSKIKIYESILSEVAPYSFYITNYVKCYTDKEPLSIQYTNCLSLLKEEIELVDPKIIVYLGNRAGSLQFSVKERFRARYMYANNRHHILLLHPHQSLLKQKLFLDSVEFLRSILPRIKSEEIGNGVQGKNNN